jgi:hypothetical protein
MTYKSMLLLLLFVSLSGCAVYGGGGYGHREYDRGQSNTYYQVQRYPVFVLPQPQRSKNYRHDGQHSDDRRYSPRYYVPAPQPRHYQSHTYPQRHDYRVAQPYAGWDGRRDRDSSRGHKQRHAAEHDGERRFERRGDDRRDNWEGWERQRN